MCIYYSIDIYIYIIYMGILYLRIDTYLNRKVLCMVSKRTEMKTAELRIGIYWHHKHPSGSERACAFWHLRKYIIIIYHHHISS